MKKSVFTLVLGLALLLISANFVEAKSSLSSEKSVAMTKRFEATLRLSKKINAMLAFCRANHDCTREAIELGGANSNWINFCSLAPWTPFCGYLENQLLQAADAWERCMNGGVESAEKIDRNFDRRKRMNTTASSNG